MTKNKRRILVGLLAIGLTLAAFYLVRSFLDADAIQVTREWARVAPIPSTAENVKVTTKGNMFTRELIVEFTASPEVILAWLRASPGIVRNEDLKVVDFKPAGITFEVKPGGGAQFAEVKIDRSGRRVTIRSYWS